MKNELIFRVYMQEHTDEENGSKYDGYLDCSVAAYDAQKEFANKEGILRLRLAMGKDTLKDTASSLSQTQYVRDQQINHYRASIVRADNSMFADVETICWSENISGDVTISRGSIPVTYCFVSKIRLSDK